MNLIANFAFVLCTFQLFFISMASTLHGSSILKVHDRSYFNALQTSFFLGRVSLYKQFTEAQLDSSHLLFITSSQKNDQQPENAHETITQRYLKEGGSSHGSVMSSLFEILFILAGIATILYLTISFTATPRNHGYEWLGESRYEKSMFFDHISESAPLKDASIDVDAECGLHHYVIHSAEARRVTSASDGEDIL